MAVTSGSPSTSPNLAFATKKAILAALNGGAVINASLPWLDIAWCRGALSLVEQSSVGHKHSDNEKHRLRRPRSLTSRCVGNEWHQELQCRGQIRSLLSAITNRKLDLFLSYFYLEGGLLAKND